MNSKIIDALHLYQGVQTQLKEPEYECSLNEAIDLLANPDLTRRQARALYNMGRRLYFMGYRVVDSQPHLVGVADNDAPQNALASLRVFSGYVSGSERYRYQYLVKA